MAPPRQGPVEVQQPDLVEEVIPVVEAVGGRVAEVAAHQGQDPGTGIIDVGGDVEEVLTEPPERHRGAEGVAGLHQQDPGADRRHQELPQGPAQGCHVWPEGAEQDVSGLVKGEVGVVQEGLPGGARGHGRGHEVEAPEDQAQQHQGSRTQGHPIPLRVRREYQLPQALTRRRRVSGPGNRQRRGRYIPRARVVLVVLLEDDAAAHAGARLGGVFVGALRALHGVGLGFGLCPWWRPPGRRKPAQDSNQAQGGRGQALFG